MIVVFKSKASGDVIMFGDVADNMMRAIGKEPTPQGIVTVEQLPAAVAQLKAAIAADKTARAGSGEQERPELEAGPDGGKQPHVTFAQRAVPLLELFEASQKQGVPVVWGV